MPAFCLATLARALAVRLIFAGYCFISVWRVVVAYRDQRYWALLLLNLGLLVESYITARENSGGEWKWFSPAMFCFIAAGVPGVCLLELRLMELRHQQAQQLMMHTHYSSEKTASELFGVYIPIYLDDFGWALALEQLMMLILICCRGLLPRGKISKEQMSQLLLVHMGMAADILELLTVFNEEKAFHAPFIVYPTLSLWTISLMQYPLVITANKPNSRKSRERRPATRDESGVCSNVDRTTAEMVGIVFSALLQDLPFLTFRLYLLFGLDIISHMMIFFTCKNALVVILQLHRLLIVFQQKKKAGKA